MNDRLDTSGSLWSATYVSINRPAELQRGAKFCPVSDLWPRGAFFLTESNWIYAEHLWYSHLLRPARCPTKNEPCLSSSTCIGFHLPIRAGSLYWALCICNFPLTFWGIACWLSWVACEDTGTQYGFPAQVMLSLLAFITLKVYNCLWHAQVVLIWETFEAREQGFLSGAGREQGHDRLACWE